jgi:hypothetical protein
VVCDDWAVSDEVDESWVEVDDVEAVDVDDDAVPDVVAVAAGVLVPAAVADGLAAATP